MLATTSVSSRGRKLKLKFMAERYVCMQCELTEERCQCDRYCAWCQGENDVRMCFDGQFYCIDCREAGDLNAQS